MTDLLGRVGLLGGASTPAPPATIAGSAAREDAAARLDLDGLCQVMRPRALAFARAYLRGATGRAAAIHAGFADSSAHGAARRLLRDPFVRRYIALARVEAALAERADLAALRAQLWAVAVGQCLKPEAGEPCRDCIPCRATTKERESARTNLTRILLVLERGGGAPEKGPAPSSGAPAGGSGGWTEDARTAFERDVLGVEVSGDTEAG